MSETFDTTQPPQGDPSQPPAVPGQGDPVPVQEPTQDVPHVTAETTGTPAPEAASGDPDVYGLTLQAHKLEDHGYWSFGVTMHGQYVPLAAVKLGLIDTSGSTQ